MSDSMQIFLNHLYEGMFIEGLAVSVVTNLARAVVAYYRMSDGYEHYLESYAAKMQAVASNRQIIYLEAAITGQLWLNAVEDDERKLEAFGRFLSLHSSLLLNNVMEAPNKDHFIEALSLLNMAIKTKAVGYGQAFCLIVDQILRKFITVVPPPFQIIAPLTNLAKTIL